MRHALRINPKTGEVTTVRPSTHRARPRTPSSATVRCGDWDWFPLSVFSGKEALAQILLEDSGFATFCPRKSRWRNRNRYDRARQTKRLIHYPWLPGLVFVGMCPPYEWHKLALRPVLHIVSTTQAEPRAMDQQAIWSLMETFEAGRFIAPDYHRHMATGEEFDPGDEVAFRDGPMADQRVIVKEINGRVAHVFGQMFGSERGFQADVASLKRID